MKDSFSPALSQLVLVLSDSDRAASLLRSFTDHGVRTLHAHDASQVESLIGVTRPDLVVVDGVGMDMDEVAMCRRLRAVHSGVLCLLSERQCDLDLIISLELGADDVILAPIDPRVLFSRLRAHLRRASRTVHPDTLAFGQLRIDVAERRAVLDGSAIALSAAEFDLLLLLARHAGATVSRDTLLRELRGFGFNGMDRSIDARIARLRRRIGDVQVPPVRIKTVRGRGYLFSRDSWGVPPDTSAD